MGGKLRLIEERENQFYVIHKSKGDYSMDIHFPYTNETKQKELKETREFAQDMSQNLNIPLEKKI